jgi:hypothetical protein
MKEKETTTNSGIRTEEPKNPETAVAAGRALIAEAEKAPTQAARHALRLEAARHFRGAIRMDASFEEAYGWLAHALRLIGQDLRESSAESADEFVRLACAVAWEAKTKTQAAALSGRTRQEAKILIAWLRATRHFTVDEAEAEMESLRARHLSEALDPEARVATN